MLYSILRDANHRVKALDLSANEFTKEHFDLIKLSLNHNKTLMSLDVRKNPGVSEAMGIINEIEKIIHANEYSYRKSSGQAR